MEKNQEFYQFSDQLRLQTGGFANLSINDSIWTPKHPEERRNFDIRPIGATNSASPGAPKPRSNDFNPFNDGWKTQLGLGAGSFNNSSFNKKGPLSPSISPSPLPSPSMKGSLHKNFNNGVSVKDREQMPSLRGLNKKFGKYSNNMKNGEPGENKKVNSDVKNSNSNNNNNGVDKRFKTLPPSEALPRNDAIGGYIFVCNNDTMQENLRRQLFGLPPRYRDSVRAITPGLPLFLYNYSTHQLHGIFEAASFGGTNIDPTAWEDKKCAGESRFPAQVKVILRKICEPLEEDSFRPILHHYDGPKFRLELSVPEALALLDIFVDSNSQ